MCSKYESVDAGHGWLIFALPPAEVAVHPSEDNDVHEFFLMCDDIQALIAEMQQKKVACSPIDEQRWGSITRLTLPGGGKLGVYQPKHASPSRPPLLRGSLTGWPPASLGAAPQQARTSLR